MHGDFPAGPRGATASITRQRAGTDPRYEYVLLAALLQRLGPSSAALQLMDRGWDSDADSADRTVDTHIKTLRTKLRAAGAHHDPIRTHRGLGYARWRPGAPGPAPVPGLS